MQKMTQIIDSKIKYSLYYVLYLVLVWSAYRISGISLPQEIDEFLVKPIIWLLPIGFILSKEGKGVETLGLTKKNLLPGIYLALFLGLIFAVEA